MDGGAIVLDFQAEKYYAFQRAEASPDDTHFFTSRGFIVQRDQIDMDNIQALDDHAPTVTFISAQQIYAFALSVVTVSVTTRIGGMRSALRLLARQKKRYAAQLLPASSPAILGPLHVFLRLRPWVYSARNHCLFDSLVLAHYLIRLRHDARVVVGVRAQPFGAHAWIQSGDRVIGDLPERVKLYTPIFVL